MNFSQRTWIIFAILYICYIIYGTLSPFNFNFSLDEIRNNLGNIEGIVPYGRSFILIRNIDAIANIFFFIPLGIILFNARYRLGHKKTYIFDIVLATLIGFFLSVFIEFAQLFIDERQTSLKDVLMNTIGGLSGAILGYVINQYLTQSARQKIRHFFSNFPTIILIIPFLLVNLFISGKFSSDFLQSERVVNFHRNWYYTFKPIWIWLLLYAYIPIGILIALKVKNRFRHVRLFTFYTISFFISLSIIGITDLIKYVGNLTSTPFAMIFLALFGILVGIVFSDVSGENRLTGSQLVHRRKKIILTGIYLLMGLIIVYKSAYPFNFNFSFSYIYDKTLYSLLSTYSYIPHPGFRRILPYLLQNILLYLPLGVILYELELKINEGSKVKLAVLSSIMLIVIPFLIKISNQNVTPFLFEIPANVFGIFLGYVIWFGVGRQRQLN